MKSINKETNAQDFSLINLNKDDHIHYMSKDNCKRMNSEL
jgi:hypothetical protein